MNYRISYYFLALLPLVWGALVWFFSFGPIEALHFTFAMQLCMGLGVLVYFFKKPLEYARRHYQPLFFEYPFKLPSWQLLVILTASTLIIRLIVINFLGFPYQSWPALQSIAMGVLGSACIEELLARIIFIITPLSSMQAILVNGISSLAMSYMHMGFEATPLPMWDYLFVRSHFLFSFSLGLIAYKTKRIELCMLLHMLSNLFNYTLPVLIMGESFQPPLSLLSGALVLLAVAGCSYRLFLSATRNSE